MEKIEIGQLFYNTSDKIHLDIPPAKLKAFVENPRKDAEKMPIEFYAKISNHRIGYVYVYPTMLHLGNENIIVGAGSTLYVDPSHRGLGIGKLLGTKRLNVAKSGIAISAGLSSSSFPLYQKLGCKMFLSPRIGLLLNANPIIKALLPTYCSWIISPIINGLLALFRLPFEIAQLSLNKISVKEVSSATDDIENIVVTDNHKFCEVHDKAWFNWHLNNTFDENPVSCQKLYEVKKEEKTIAFFMYKIRIKNNLTSYNIQNVKVISLMEWGIQQDENFSEFRLLCLIIRTMYKEKADILEISFLNTSLMKRLQLMGFIKMADGNIGIYISKTSSYKSMRELEDENNWRLRPAYADFALS